MIDLGFIETMAKVQENGGFDRVLQAFHAESPECLLVGQHVASVTERLGLMIAHRPGFVAPTLTARQFATLDHLRKGRAAIHIITGADDAELARDGDHLTKAERYARTREYLDIMRQEWTATAPFDYAGKYYQVEQAISSVRPTRASGIPVHFGGTSPEAMEVVIRTIDAGQALAGYLPPSRLEPTNGNPGYPIQEHTWPEGIARRGPETCGLDALPNATVLTASDRYCIWAHQTARSTPRYPALFHRPLRLRSDCKLARAF